MTVMVYERPTTVADACRMLATHGDEAMAIVGGTAVVPMLQRGEVKPRALVSLQHLRNDDATCWRGVQVTADRVRIGAGTALTDVVDAPALRSEHRALAMAAASVGNPRIRNVGTLGGNLILADRSSDLTSTLVSLDARIRVQSPDDVHEVPIASFVLGHHATALGSADIVTEVVMPRHEVVQNSIYLKFRSLSALDAPCVGIAAAAAPSGGHGHVLAGLRLVVGAVADRPQEFVDLLEPLRAGEAGDMAIAECAAGYAARISPFEDHRASAWYRRQMVEVHVARALRELRASGDRAR